MAKALQTGITGTASVLVTADNTAEKFGNSGAAVFATPMLVGLMEHAAREAIGPYLESSEGSVGTKIDISHLAATPMGMTVTATATLEAVDGKRLMFSVEASDDKEVVGRGKHERYLVQMKKFFERAAAK